MESGGNEASGRRVSGGDIETGLRRIGVEEGDVLLVHSSLSRFGYVEGGADEVIDALLRAVGPGGTLMMSAITTQTAYVVACIEAAQRGEMASVERFDVLGMPTYAGAIAETFRRRPGVRRSWHPTHSVTAIGRRAEELLADHENASGPCGAGTPYGRLCDCDRGFVLLLGVNHMSNTTLHGIEEMAGVEYVLYPEWVRIPLKTPAGPREARTRVHNAFIGRNLGILETQYIDGMAQRVGQIGGSYVRLIHAAKMRDITLAAMQDDPLRLLNERGMRAWAEMKRSGNFARDPRKPA